jgi:hypothetical protein
LLLCAHVALAGDIAIAPGSTPIERVFTQANLVCNCVVKSLDDRISPMEIRGRPAVHHQVTAHVAIEDIFKSNDQKATEINVVYTIDEQKGQRVSGSRLALSKGETALLFLTKAGLDTYEFSDPFIGASQFSSLPTQPGDMGLTKLQQVLAAVVQTAGQTDQLKALQMLQGFDHIADGTLSIVKPLCQSSDANTALTAIGVLLKTKSPESVLRLQLYLDSYTTDAQPVALFVIGPELGEITNAKALPALEALSASRFLSITFGAMDGIRHIRDAASVPTLIRRLDDTNSTVQYGAVITLAEICGKFEGDYAPSMYLFDKKPEYYVGLWKKWWSEEGNKLYKDKTTDRAQP